MRDNSSPGTVLVVEDNDMERETLLALLRRSQYTAWGVGDASSALLALEHKGCVDVVLCEMRLKSSDQSGVDLLRRWKERRPSTPFIFVTGVHDIAQVVEAVKLGAEDYITKPYRAAELLRRVQDCIDAAQGGPAQTTTDSAESLDARFDISADLSLEQLERAAIECALRRTAGNRTHAADALQISVRTLQRKLKAWSSEAAHSGAAVAEGVT